MGFCRLEVVASPTFQVQAVTVPSASVEVLVKVVVRLVEAVVKLAVGGWFCGVGALTVIVLALEVVVAPSLSVARAVRV